MTIFIALLLAILSFAIIAYPFFRSKPRTVAAARDERNNELLARQDTNYAMLKELEADYQSGILTQEEYKELEASYRQRADTIAGDIKHSGKAHRADEIEQKVLEMRRKKSSPKSETAPSIPKAASPEDEIERQVRELRQKKGLACPKCGQGYRKGDRFCSKCAAPLGRGGKR